MKKSYTLLFILFLWALDARAQDYSPIVPGNTSLFIDYNSFIGALHVDSITTDTKGTAYHFLKTWESGPDCISYHQPTWPGSKCVQHDDTSFFFNYNQDTLYFYPLKELNDSWVFYKYLNGDYVEAKVTAKEQRTFLGLSDSVKTVTLQRKDVNGNNLTNNMIGTSISFSKYHGFVSPLSFFHFPDLQSLDLHGELTLVGLTTPQVGTQLMTSNDIFNYDVGDIFHYDSVYSYPTSHTGEGKYEKQICTVLEKNFSANTDTVIYKIARILDRQTYNWQTQVETNTYGQKDTIIEKHVLNEPLYYPEQAIPSLDASLFLERRPFPLYTLKQNGDYNNRPQLVPSYDIPHYNGSCWISYILEFPTPSYSFAKGLGLADFNANVYSGIDQEYKHLVYFKKGSETWGTPLTLSTYSKVASTASLFPNPLKQGDWLHIESPDFLTQQVMVYNSMGIQIKHFASTGTVIESLDLSELQPGLYVVQLLNSKNEFITSKLIIK